MLKSTQNPLSKEQFTHLREARTLIKEQFAAEFSLSSDQVVHDLYEFALRSETNELFRLFSNLNGISDTPVGEPLNEEQFILLREARQLVEKEFDDDLNLADAGIMPELYARALGSEAEDLFDIYRYLNSREDLREPSNNQQSGTYFRKLREARRIAEVQLAEDVTLTPATAIDTLAELAIRSEDELLLSALHWLKSWNPGDVTPTELLFHELSAPDFERLREAKLDVYTEFGETLSLHADSSLDDLYEFALRSRDTFLFELFCDLLEPQMAPRDSKNRPSHWFSRDQYTLLRAARETILAEFDDQLDITAADVYVTLYGYALRAEDEDLFDLCKELHNLGSPAPKSLVLPSKEEFRMLRQAQALIQQEFGKALELNAEAVREDLYRYAVNSEADDLFDIHTELETLANGGEPKEPVAQLTRDEFVALRQARSLIREEFTEHLALEDTNVLDRLYEFALQSDGETLFDLHAELNANAMEMITLEPVERPTVVAAPEPEAVPEIEAETEPEPEPEPKAEPEAEPKAEPKAVHQEPEETTADIPEEKTADTVEASTDTEPSGLKKVFGILRGGAPKPRLADALEEKAAVKDNADAVSDKADAVNDKADTVKEKADAAKDKTDAVEEKADAVDDKADADGADKAADAAAEAVAEEEAPATPHTSFPDLLVKAIDQAPKNGDDAEQKPAQGKKRRNKPQRRRTAQARVSDVSLDESSENTSTPKSAARKSAAEEPVADLAAAAEEAKAQAVPAGWYISTLDDRLRVRLSTRLSVGEDGELLIAAPPGTDICAIIEMSSKAPVVIVQNGGDLKVNDTKVEGRQELANGDRIAVADTELQVEYEANPKPDTALSAG